MHKQPRRQWPHVCLASQIRLVRAYYVIRRSPIIYARLYMATTKDIALALLLSRADADIWP